MNKVLFLFYFFFYSLHNTSLLLVYFIPNNLVNHNINSKNEETRLFIKYFFFLMAYHALQLLQPTSWNENSR